MPLEKSLESTFAEHGARRGLLVLKLVCVSRYGFPDRTVLGSERRIAFAELKQKGEKPTPLQRWWIANLKRMGFHVAVIDHLDQIDPFYEAMN